MTDYYQNDHMVETHDTLVGIYVSTDKGVKDTDS